MVEIREVQYRKDGILHVLTLPGAVCIEDMDKDKVDVARCMAEVLDYLRRECVITRK